MKSTVHPLLASEASCTRSSTTFSRARPPLRHVLRLGPLYRLPDRLGERLELPLRDLVIARPRSITKSGRSTQRQRSEMGDGQAQLGKGSCRGACPRGVARRRASENRVRTY